MGRSDCKTRAQIASRERERTPTYGDNSEHLRSAQKKMAGKDPAMTAQNAKKGQMMTTKNAAARRHAAPEQAALARAWAIQTGGAALADQGGFVFVG